ncbi:uncharacterized protein LOC123309646 [Coccinella septempunctata]|uniref:uncharacterized protein LOC123309646 n=1 Tax=Coccinella septempunctata TaxID=41139 RepID=UPI001D08B665|nr:uncharacterized protein LOC123309646 [Coccinella septempunctata]
MALTTTLVMVTRTYFSKTNIEKFLDSLDKIDEYLKPNWKKNKGFKRFFLTQHIFIFLVFSFNINTWIILTGIYDFHFHIFKHLYYYQISINNALVYIFSCSIEYRFQQLSKKFTSEITEGDNSIQTMRIFNRMYMLLGKAIRFSNSVFGFSVLGTVCFVIVDLLMNASVLTHFLISESGMAPGFLKNALMISARIGWMTFSLSLPTMLAISCSGAMKAAREVSEVCTEYLNLLPMVTTNQRIKALKKQLRLLSAMSTSIKPFSAARFFTINHSMLGLIIGSVPPYFIFMLQCLQSETINYYNNESKSD